MRKPGHHLAEIMATATDDSPERMLLNSLGDQFSITTAEELIAANAQWGERLREALHPDEKAWINLVNAAREVVGPEEVQRLSMPTRGRPGGARLTRLTPEQRKKYADGVIVE